MQAANGLLRQASGKKLVGERRGVPSSETEPQENPGSSAGISPLLTRLCGEYFPFQWTGTQPKRSASNGYKLNSGIARLVVSVEM